MDEDSSSSGDDSNIMGAIFMCGGWKMHKCFKSNIFGLPPSHANFVKKVKSGMFLFLFEPDMRKLYGVFEATSDGDMNIDCDAFSSYPAQVRFNTLWKCYPLSEDEFRDAIRDNYYTPTRFYFGLSYEQVCKLIKLFSLKKTSPPNHSSLGVHRANSSMCVTKPPRSVRFATIKDRKDNDFRSAHYWKYTTYYQTHGLTFEDTNRSYPIPPGVSQPQLSNLNHSSSQFDHHLILPTFEATRKYDILDAGTPSLAQKLADTHTPNFRSHLYQLHSHSDYVDLSCPDYHILDSYKVPGIDEPNLTPKFTETMVPHFRSRSHSPQPILETLNLPSTNYSSSVISSIHDKLSVQKESSSNSPNHVISNDSPTSKSHANDTPNSLPSVLNPSSSHEVDNARGLRYWKLLPVNEEENLVMNVEPPDFISLYSSETSDVNEYDNKEKDFQSDVREKRTSVFSRLSKSQEGSRQRDNTSDPYTNSADLIELLFQRRKQMKESKKSVARDNHVYDHRRLKNPVPMELIGVDSPVDLFSDSVAVAEDCIVPPFLNFKRKSESEIEDGEIRESDLVEGVTGKCKRQKLVRPSLPEIVTSIQSERAHEKKTAPEDGVYNGNHMNPKDPTLISTMLPIGVSFSGELLLGSKDKVVDVTDANAENVSVEPGIGCIYEGNDNEGDGKADKESESNSKVQFDANSNKPSDVNHKSGLDEGHILTAHLNCEVDQSNETREKKETSYGELAIVDTVEMKEGDESDALNLNDGSFFDGKVDKASLKSDANFSLATALAKSGTTEEDPKFGPEVRPKSDSLICSLDFSIYETDDEDSMSC